jgi:hypothetical protein
VPGNPAQTGLWSPVLAWPTVTVHANVLPNGRVLTLEGADYGTQAWVWNPLSGAFTPVGLGDNVFCSGHTGLADGRVLVVGGHIANHVGLDAANLFDPATQTWTALPPMAYGRWYPTATMLGDGRVLVTSGETACDGCYAAIPEIYNPATNSWTSLTGASWGVPFYPHMFLLPDGRVLASSTFEYPVESRVLNVNNQTWTTIDPVPVDGGSAAMYLPGKIMKSGTSTTTNDPTRASDATAYVLDMTQPSPRWRAIAPMSYGRTYHNSTILPDGTVLVTGGGMTTDAGGTAAEASAALTPELWNPVNEQWTSLAPMREPRLYHSVALLLPDGRVVVSGGGRVVGQPSYDHPTA